MQRSSVRLHPSTHIRGQTTLLACNRRRLPCPEFLGFTDDRETELRSANLAYTTQLRSWSKGSSNQLVPFHQRSNRSKSRESLVEGRGTCHPACSSVLCQGPSIVRPYPSDMQWPWIELLPRSHDLPACLSACNCHVSMPTYHPDYSLAAFRIRSAERLTEALEDPTLQPITVA